MLNKKMNILRVIPSVNPEHGGTVNGLVSSSELLEELGHSVSVASLDNPDSEWIRAFKFAIYTFKSTLGKYSYSYPFKKWLAKNVVNYDVVIIEGIWQYHSVVTCSACRANAVPYVLFTHGMLDPWFNQNNIAKHIKKFFYWHILEANVVRYANYVLFTCEEEKLLARTSFSRYYAKERVVAFGSPIPDVEESQAKQAFFSQFPQLKDKTFGLFLSRIDRKKGLDLLVTAFANLDNPDNDFQIVIAGPDKFNLKRSIMKSVPSVSHSKIHWIGMIRDATKWGAFYASECFILPSHQENFGIVVSESLSTSTPVLISNKVNIWREIDKCAAGIINEDTLSGTEQTLTKWLNFDDAQKEEMAINAQNCYWENFDISSAAQSLEQVLLGIIRSSHNVKS